MARKSAPKTDSTATRIRKAALKLFASRGFEGTGIRDIAEEAGLALSGIYHYVDNKEELLLEIAKNTMKALQDAGEDAIREGSTPTERLRGLIRGHVQIHGRNRLEALVTDRELRAMSKSQRKKIVRLRDDYENLWSEVLKEGNASGEFHLDEPGLGRLGLLQMCTGVAYWYSPKGQRSIGEIADVFADLGVAMVSARTGSI